MAMKQLCDRLEQYWTAERVEANPGVSEESLNEFEDKRCVVLPPDLRQYLQRTNGMPEGESDKLLLRFWPLGEIRPINEILQEIPKSLGGVERSMFAFADWSIEAHIYLIQLWQDDSRLNTIHVVGQTSH